MKRLERYVLKRKKMAMSRVIEVRVLSRELGGETRKRLLWHARCTYSGIGPRTRRLAQGEMVQCGAGETTFAAKT